MAANGNSTPGRIARWQKYDNMVAPEVKNVTEGMLWRDATEAAQGCRTSWMSRWGRRVCRRFEKRGLADLRAFRRGVWRLSGRPLVVW